MWWCIIMLIIWVTPKRDFLWFGYCVTRARRKISNFKYSDSTLKESLRSNNFLANSTIIELHSHHLWVMWWWTIILIIWDTPKSDFLWLIDCYCVTRTEIILCNHHVSPAWWYGGKWSCILSLRKSFITLGDSISAMSFIKKIPSTIL